MAKKVEWQRPDWWPTGQKDNVDHSINFKCVGGPAHGWIVRLYEPFDEIVLQRKHRYVLTPPTSGSKSTKWMLVHSGEVNNG